MTVQPMEVPSRPGVDDDIIHAVCPQCYPDTVGPAVAVCGLKGAFGMLAEDEEPPLERVCVVCLDLVPAGCGICGYRG